MHDTCTSSLLLSWQNGLEIAAPAFCLWLSASCNHQCAGTSARRALVLAGCFAGHELQPLPTRRPRGRVSHVRSHPKKHASESRAMRKRSATILSPHRPTASGAGGCRWESQRELSSLGSRTHRCPEPIRFCTRRRSRCVSGRQRLACQVSGSLRKCARILFEPFAARRWFRAGLPGRASKTKGRKRNWAKTQCGGAPTRGGARG